MNFYDQIKNSENIRITPILEKEVSEDFEIKHKESFDVYLKNWKKPITVVYMVSSSWPNGLIRIYGKDGKAIYGGQIESLTLLEKIFHNAINFYIKESMNFERGGDPFERLGIGLRPKMLEIIRNCHMESRDAADKYFGKPYLDTEVIVLKSTLWWIYFDKKNPDESFTQSCINYEMNKEQREKIADVLKRELNMTVKYLGYDS